MGKESDEVGGEREREEEEEKERKKSICERNINQLPSVCAPTGDQTCNLLVCRTALQATEPPRQGLCPVP